jgi:hypothetical protein
VGYNVSVSMHGTHVPAMDQSFFVFLRHSTFHVERLAYTVISRGFSSPTTHLN